MNVKIGVSARHVHLTQGVIDVLFNGKLHPRNNLSQIGQFAAIETVTIKTDKAKFDNVRVVGPAREYNQVEISKSDARFLGIDPPVRKSGDLTNASHITIETEYGSLSGNFAIIIDRHMHINTEDAKRLGIKDGDIFKFKLGKEKSGIIDVNTKVSDDGFLEVHLDTDDANAFLIKNGDIGYIMGDINEVENRKY